MKLRYNFEFVNVGDDITAVPISGDNLFNGVLIVNETMKDILEIMGTNDFSGEYIVDVMKNRYADIPKDELLNTIQGICVDLIEKGIIEE